MNIVIQCGIRRIADRKTTFTNLGNDVAGINVL